MDHLYDKIENYLNDHMSAPDRAAFEEEIRKDPELAEEVEIHRQILLQYDEDSWAFAKKSSDNDDARALETYFKSGEAEDLSGAIQEAGDLYKSHNSRIRRRKFFYYAAASVALLLLAGNFFINRNTPESLYADYANWDEIPSLTLRGENTNALAEGEQHFKQEKYEEAIEVFETYTEEHDATQNAQLLTYLGAAYLEAGQYENAINIFDTLQNANTLDSDKALWYKALTYLKQDDKEKVIQQLETLLSNPGHPYVKEAESLKSRLK